mmetsp:Transcript_28208/g.67074  ORF Transcript_28208/g.67074 Transcript_28208/m.67074 type:complete len:220 (-) Transcript_28208:480-1139(-)
MPKQSAESSCRSSFDQHVESVCDDHGDEEYAVCCLLSSAPKENLMGYPPERRAGEGKAHACGQLELQDLLSPLGFGLRRTGHLPGFLLHDPQALAQARHCSQADGHPDSHKGHSKNQLHQEGHRRRIEKRLCDDSRVEADGRHVYQSIRMCYAQGRTPVQRNNPTHHQPGGPLENGSLQVPCQVLQYGLVLRRNHAYCCQAHDDHPDAADCPNGMPYVR